MCLLQIGYTLILDPRCGMSSTDHMMLLPDFRVAESNQRMRAMRIRLVICKFSLQIEDS